MAALTQNNSNVIPMPPSPPDISITRSVRFGLYIFILPCSLLCTLYLLYHLFTNKIHRQALHNHSIMFLLLSGILFELIDLTLQMDYLNLGYVRFQSPILCLIWMFIEFWCHAANSLLLTWASFERHILVFHHQWLSKYKYNKILFHYLPLIILFIYLSIYYLVAIIFPPCSTIFDYNSQLCGFFPCFLVSLPSIALWDAIVHNTIPALLISLTISTWYLLIHFPMMLSVCIVLTGSTNLIMMEMGPYLAYLSYYVILLMPFVCLISMWKDIRSSRQRRLIFPVNNAAINANQQRKPPKNI
jgi:hypothetical protein